MAVPVFGRVGCGDKFRFWEDSWAGNDRTLMAKYPRLYQVSNQQQQTINCMGGHNAAGWDWNFSGRRPLFEIEIAMAADFLEETAQLTIHQNTAYSWIWKADPSRNFLAKTAYQLLLAEKMGENEDRIFMDLWKLKIPSKAAVFARRLIRD